MLKSLRLITTVVLVMLIIIDCNDLKSSGRQNESSWQKEFNLIIRNLSDIGRNKYFILEPGYQLVLEDRFTKLTITVLDETKIVDGVKTRIVEEKEWIRGDLYEVSRNFFAVDKNTKDVFYFGEEVDFYKNGEVADHYGAWEAGLKEARAGMQMPGDTKVGMKYYQEIAPEVAMDRADKFETPAGKFTNCLTTKEGTALNFREVEFKTYAPGIGLIQDESLLLTRHGFIKKN